MIRDTKWRLGVLMGVLAVLWTIGFPFLAQFGIIPVKLGPANIGAGFLLVAPLVLIESLMVFFVFFVSIRPWSFGVAVPLLVFQVVLIRLTFPAGLQIAFLLNLPGCMTLLIVGIVYYLRRGRR